MWYCETSSQHLHSTEWEAENCTKHAGEWDCETDEAHRHSTRWEAENCTALFEEVCILIAELVDKDGSGGPAYDETLTAAQWSEAERRAFVGQAKPWRNP